MSHNPPDALPRIDRDLVEQVRQLETVRPGVLRQLVTMFEQNTARLLGDIDARLAARQTDALRVAFHSLKGTSASLGALRLSQLAAIAEGIAAGEDDAAAALPPLATALRAEFAAACAELETVARSGDSVRLSPNRP